MECFMLEIKPHLTPQRCVPRPLLWGHICHGFYLNVLILYQKYKIERVNFMVSNRENGLLYGELAEGMGPWWWGGVLGLWPGTWGEGPWELALDSPHLFHSRRGFKRFPTRSTGFPGCVCVLVGQACPTLCDPMACSPPGSSVHGMLQARTLEWVAMLSSRGPSQPRDWTSISCMAGGFFTIWATREAP